MKNFIEIYSAVKAINLNKFDNTEKSKEIACKDAEKALVMIFFPSFLWVLGIVIQHIPLVGFIGILWKGAVVGGHLFLGWIYWPVLFFYISNTFIQISWFGKDERRQIFYSENTEPERYKLIQELILKNIRQIGYIRLRTHTIYLSIILGLTFSYNFTARIDYWLSGSPTAFIFYKDLPILRGKHDLYETLTEGMMASSKVTEKVRLWCKAENFPWDVCLELESFPGFEWENRGSWKPNYDSDLKERLRRAFGE